LIDYCPGGSLRAVMLSFLGNREIRVLGDRRAKSRWKYGSGNMEESNNNGGQGRRDSGHERRRLVLKGPRKTGRV